MKTSSFKNILFITPQIVYPQYDGGKKSTLGRIMGFSNSGAKVCVVSFNVTGQDETESVTFFKKRSIPYYTVASDTAKNRKNKLLFMLGYFIGLFSKKPRYAQNHICKEAPYLIANLIDKHKLEAVIFDHLWTVEACDYTKIKNPILIEHNIEYVLLKETAKSETNIIVKLLQYFEAFRTYFYEKKIIKHFPNVVFLSQHDLDSAVGKGFVKKENCSLDSNSLFIESPVKRKRPQNSPPYILFTGSLNFEPNMYGISWFLSNCFDKIIDHYPELKLFITGPAKEKIKRKVLRYNNVEITGLVSDLQMSELLAKCVCIISPILSGSGIKIKNVEAVLQKIPIVMTEFSGRGITANNTHSRICKSNSPQEFTEELLFLLKEGLKN